MKQREAETAMSLKLIVDKLEDVEEAMRPLYAAKDGKFVLQVEGIEDTTNLRSALGKERTRADEAEKQVKRWLKLGKTDVEIEELLAAQAKDAEEKATKAGEWDKLRAQMNEKHDAAIKAMQVKLDAKDGDMGAMRKSLEHHLIDSQATAAIAALKGKVKPLLPHVRDQVKLIEEDGKYSIKVVDGKGDPRVNAKGEPLTLTDVVAEMRASEDFGGSFEGSNQSGGGMRPNNGGGGPGAVKRRSEFKSEKERAAFVDEHGIEAYQGLAD